MKITFILKSGIEFLPPIFPRIVLCAERNHNVTVICSKLLDEYKTFFNQKGIKFFETNHNTKIFNRHCKILDWIGFNKSVWSIVKRENLSDSVLYICSGDTALALGGELLKHKYALQSNELYDTNSMYKKMLKKFAVNAMAFVVPEFSRANICMYWYGLKKMPFVIPNYPYISKENTGIEDIPQNAVDIVNSISDKKIVLYQGVISAGDRSLGVIAEALSQINDENYVLLLMGKNKNSSYEAIKQVYGNTYYIPFIAAPKHLWVTGKAHIGVLSYDRISLNNIFCAPNKIYEYSAFGVPMLGNNIPGLKYCIETNDMGVCADFEDVQNVKAAILELSKGNENYSKKSKEFFESFAFIEETNRLIDFLDNNAI
ncbi:MAG: glycosyltransferase family 4 protein [Ruminococcaceae bacterium]|nr:glycosyltransferase family 4 protein [Oscillospiraceae bacterium]